MAIAEVLKNNIAIGALPWVETTENAVNARTDFIATEVDFFRVARLPIVDGQVGEYLRAQLQSFGVTSVVKYDSVNKTKYLTVNLDDEFGSNQQKLDALRLASTEWKEHTFLDGTKVLRASADREFIETLYQANKKIDIDPIRAQESLANVYRRHGLDVATIAGEKLSLEVPWHQWESLLLAQYDAEEVIHDALDAPKNMGPTQGRRKYDVIDESALENAGGYAKNTKEMLANAGEYAHNAITKYPKTIGGVFGFVAAIPAAIETYNTGRHELYDGNVPIGATTKAAEYAAEFTVGAATGASVAEAALPLLAIPAPAGELAYGTAVLGAGYFGAEATKDLIVYGDYYLAKAKTYFQNDARGKFEAQVIENAVNSGRNPDEALRNVYNKMAEEQARKKAPDHSSIESAEP